MDTFLDINNKPELEERTSSLHHEKSLVGIILFGVASNQRNVTTRIITNCLKEGVYSIEKGIACTVNANVSERDMET